MFKLWLLLNISCCIRLSIGLFKIKAKKYIEQSTIQQRYKGNYLLVYYFSM